MSQPASPGTDDHVGLTRHAGMHGRVPQSKAEVGVASIGRQTADHVAWVDVLEAYRNALSPKSFRDLVPQGCADFPMAAIARRIKLRCLCHQVLARSFRDDDHHVTIPVDALSGR